MMTLAPAQRSQKSGLPPGTMVHIGEKRPEPVLLQLMQYDEAQVTEKELATVEESFPYLTHAPVTWLNVTGIHDLEVIRKLGEHLKLHPLVLEDLVNTHQRPKVEDYEDYLFIVLKMLSYDQESGEVEVEQVGLILGPTYVIAFQEDATDVFDSVRQRIRAGGGRLRKAGADYLAYTLIDAVVDNYFVILEQMGDEIEVIETDLVAKPDRATLGELSRLKQEMIALRRAVWPLREVLATMQRGDSSLITHDTQFYLRDVQDHTVQIMETVESMRDSLAGMLDIYLTSLSNRMNEIMKVLTIFSAIFIPMTFVAGVYGMNFRVFPEIQWRYGYVMFWLIILGILVTMMIYFRRKRWI